MARAGLRGEMRYLEDPRRRNPVLIQENLRSAIVCALNYNTDLPYSVDAAAASSSAPRGWISRYAWGRDYHEVVWEKLDALAASLRDKFPEPFAARAFADTGPVTERIFAKHAGLGWLGKNTLLLNESLGSWFFLGVILTSLDLTPSRAPEEAPPADLCGNCRQCLDACPTGALVEPYVLDARRCISYLTIELRGNIPEEFRAAMGRHVFGCDIARTFARSTARRPVTHLAEFQPRGGSGATPARARKEAEAIALGERGRPGPPFAGESLFEPRLEWLAGMNEQEFSRSLPRERHQTHQVERVGAQRVYCFGEQQACAGCSRTRAHTCAFCTGWRVSGTRDRGICPMGLGTHPIRCNASVEVRPAESIRSVEPRLLGRYNPTHQQKRPPKLRSFHGSPQVSR